MKSVQEHGEVVEAYVQGEREAGRLLGPFERSQFPEIQVSAFGVIPKSEPQHFTVRICGCLDSTLFLRSVISPCTHPYTIAQNSITLS